jgi:predicted helicase
MALLTGRMALSLSYCCFSSSLASRKVFENLLATYNPETGKQARKATGSFYTPREIVSYMVDESLKQHFETHTDLTKSQIDALFVMVRLIKNRSLQI